MQTTLPPGLLTGLILWIGGAIRGQAGVSIAHVFAGLMYLGAYGFSDKLVPSMDPS